MNEGKRQQALAKRACRITFGCQRHCNTVRRPGRLNRVLPTIFISQVTCVRLTSCWAVASLLSLGVHGDEGQAGDAGVPG